MYENIKPEDILQRMLDRVPASFDKRVGSLIYNALMPASIEFKQMLIELDVVYAETFADKAGRESLIKRAQERGIAPLPATRAVFRCTSDAPIPVGTRFTQGPYFYTTTEQISAAEFKVEAETAGSDPNTSVGAIIPVEYIDGLTRAEIVDLLIPGNDEEETESLRTRYFSSFSEQAFGGNRADYKEKVGALPGVGGVKANRAPEGGGTVSVVIIDSDYNVPSASVIESVQTALDPVGTRGEGLGIAPIGHVVTVTGVTALTVDVATTITFAPGWDWPTLEPFVTETLDQYFLELRQAWDTENQLIVRTVQIEARLLNLAGVVDIANTTINGGTANIVLGVDEIPERGSLNV